MSSREEMARRALAAAEAAARRDRGPAPARDHSPSGSQSEDPHDVARQIVLRQLTMAPRSRAQLAEKLRQRGCDDDVAAAVLDRMEAVGLVDDEAFAAMLVRTRRAGRGLARRALRAELRQKGVDEDAAEAVLHDVSDDDERERARELIARRLPTLHGLPAATQVRRLAGMLARKGYSTEIAYAVVREALEASPEHARD